jgi:hypothetical protein
MPRWQAGETGVRVVGIDEEASTGGRSGTHGRSLRVAVGVVAAVAVTVGLSTWLVTRERGRDPSPGPASASGPPVVRLRDAVDAVAGRDYDVIGTLRGTDAEQATALAPDGVVVLARYDARDYPTYSLFDPRTGDRTPVEAAPGRAVVDAVTADQVVTSSVTEGRLTVVVFDRASGSTTRRTLPRVPALPGAHPITDVGVSDGGTIWFLTFAPCGESGPCTHTQLWQAAAGARPRLVARVTDFAVTSDAVAWTDPPDRASATVHVRDLADGKASTFTLPRCTAGSQTAALESVLGRGELLAFDAVCRHAPWTATFLMDPDGSLVADVTVGEEPFPTSLGDDAIALTPAFVYDAGRRRLLRLARATYEHSPWPQAAGDLVAWRIGTGMDGGPLQIARLR